MTRNREYYEAYDERYKSAHSKGIQWFSDESSLIVSETIAKFSITKDMKILEIGCGEGRDARILLENGFDLIATDISHEAISYCKKKFDLYKDSFKILNCIKDSCDEKFDFIYAVAVIHMLVLDEDRKAFYRFIYEHLTPNGIALICTMGDGRTERQSNTDTAFELQERNHNGETLLVAGTSCRMISDEAFDAELTGSDLKIIERGQTSIPPEFSDIMYAVVKKAEQQSERSF